MENYIVVAVLLIIAIAIIVYLVRAKKQGNACVGCPNSKQCSGSCYCTKNKHT